MGEYFSYLASHAILIVIAFLTGRALQRGIVAGSEARRVHGRYVLWWSVGAFAVGGSLGPFVVHADMPNGAAGLAGFCLLAGWLVGTIHGAVVVANRRPYPPSCPRRMGGRTDR